MSYKMKFMVWPLVLLFANLFTILEALPNDLDQKTNALNILGKFAIEMCKDIPITGEGENIELTGKAESELNSLISKFVNLKVEGAAKYYKEEYRGILQKDLVFALSKSTDCKLELIKLFHDDFFPKDVAVDDVVIKKYKVLGISIGMSVAEAQKILPQLKIQKYGSTYWLVANSTYIGDNATYYFHISNDKKQKIDGVFIRGERKVLATDPQYTKQSFQHAKEIRTWCTSDRPDQLRSEISRILGVVPSNETGWVKENTEDNALHDKFTEMCTNRFGISYNDDPLMFDGGDWKCKGFTAEQKQSLKMTGNDSSNTNVTGRVEQGLLCIDQHTFNGNFLLRFCEVSCTTEFSLYL